MPNRATMIRSLMTLQTERRSGIVTIKGDDDAGFAIYLRAGEIVFAREVPSTTTLGERLVRQGALSAEALGRIAAKMAQVPSSPDSDVLFCEVAIAQGFLPQLLAWSQLKAHVRRTLLRTFQLTTVEWTFEDAAAHTSAALDYVARYKFDLEPFLTQAMRGMDPAALANELERLLDIEVILTAPPAEIQTRYDLTMAETRLLTALAECAEHTPRALLATSEAKAVDALAVLVALATTHVLRRAIGSPTSSRSMPAVMRTPASPFSPTPPNTGIRPTLSSSGAPPAASMTPRSIPAAQRTTLTSGAPSPLTKSTPASVQVSRPPDSQRSIPVAPSSQPNIAISRPPQSNRSIPVAPPSSRPSLGAGAGAAARAKGSSLPPRSDVRRISSNPNLSAISRSRGDSVDRARNSTTPYPQRNSRNPGSDPNRPSAEAREMGERWMKAGIEHARAGRWAKASSDFHQALEHIDSEPLRLYAMWSEIHARANEPATRSERTELARLALSTTKSEPEFAFGWYVAGTLMDTDPEQAHKLFSRAVKLDPGLLDAVRRLRVVENQGKAEQAPVASKGIFGRKLW